MTNDKDCVEPLDHKPPKKRLAFHVSMTVITFATIITGLYIVAQVWPYSDVTVEWVGGLDTDEYTSDDIPVIREGESIDYTINYCNTGVDIRTFRWLDSYGSVDQVTNIDAPDDLVSSSRLLFETYYPIYDVGTGCFDDLKVSVQLGFQINTGVYYSLRSISSYKPNFLHQEHYETKSPIFYYAAEDEELP